VCDPDRRPALAVRAPRPVSPRFDVVGGARREPTSARRSDGPGRGRRKFICNDGRGRAGGSGRPRWPRGLASLSLVARGVHRERWREARERGSGATGLALWARLGGLAEQTAARSAMALRADSGAAGDGTGDLMQLSDVAHAPLCRPRAFLVHLMCAHEEEQGSTQGRGWGDVPLRQALTQALDDSEAWQVLDQGLPTGSHRPHSCGLSA